jgi:hypothetical protein
MLLPVGFFPKTSSKFPLSSPPFQYDSVTSLSCKLHSRLFYSTLDEKLPRPVRSWLEPIPKVKVGKENSEDRLNLNKPKKFKLIKLTFAIDSPICSSYSPLRREANK